MTPTLEVTSRVASSRDAVDIVRRISFRSAARIASLSLWGQVGPAAPDPTRRESGGNRKGSSREPLSNARRSLRALQCAPDGPVASEGLAALAPALCFAALLRWMTVFTTCWKRRKKGSAMVAATVAVATATLT